MCSAHVGARCCRPSVAVSIVVPKALGRGIAWIQCPFRELPVTLRAAVVDEKRDAPSPLMCNRRCLEQLKPSYPSIADHTEPLATSQGPRLFRHPTRDSSFSTKLHKMLQGRRLFCNKLEPRSRVLLRGEESFLMHGCLGRQNRAAHSITRYTFASRACALCPKNSVGSNGRVNILKSSVSTLSKRI